jgi:FkbM family methyltransferase
MSIKIEEKIKEKFLYSKKNNILKSLYFFLQRFKLAGLKKNYTVTGVDLLLDYFFKNAKIKNGIYIDVGCNHPLVNNYTYLLYKSGWSGINIDLDFHYIDMFNHFRPLDFNRQVAISDVRGEADLFFYHNKSAINTLSKEMHLLRGSDAKEIRKIQTETLNNVIKESKFSDKKVNLLSIDVEGFELNVLKGFDFEKYSPELVVVEYIDPAMKKAEFYNQNINNIINSELYNFMIDKNYKFINWFHSDLIFVNNKVRDQ